MSPPPAVEVESTDVQPEKPAAAPVAEELENKLQLQTQAAQQFMTHESGVISQRSEASTATVEAQAEDDEEEVHETSVEARDIDLVMNQAGVSRSKVVKALKGHDGDIVSVIMELTT